MKKNINSLPQQTVLSVLFFIILISSFSIIGFGQTLDSEEEEVTVPEQAMEQVVKRVLVWSFKPRTKPTLIFLAEQRIKQSWMPTIKNIEFRLLSDNEIQQKNLEVYFFTETEFSEKTYNIGFAFGTLNCRYLGDYWHFKTKSKSLAGWKSRRRLWTLIF